MVGSRVVPAVRLRYVLIYCTQGEFGGLRYGWDQVAKREQGLNLQNDICRTILHLYLSFVRPSVISLCTILLYSIIAERALQCGSTTTEHMSSSSRAYSTGAALRRRLSNGIPYI